MSEDGDRVVEYASMDDLACWRPDGRECPNCDAPTLGGNWWDDPPEIGGACIGTARKCTRCDYYETW